MDTLHAVLSQEDGWWVAECVEFAVVGQGSTQAEAQEELVWFLSVLKAEDALESVQKDVRSLVLPV
jgi:predicted RNase H-like HicB family nuclease